MTDLFDRLYPEDIDTERIPVHYFFAALVDYASGFTTRQQIINFWGLDEEAQIDFNTLCNKIDSITGATNKLAFAEQLHAVFLFAEAEAKYTTKEDFRQRLDL